MSWMPPALSALIAEHASKVASYLKDDFTDLTDEERSIKCAEIRRMSALAGAAISPLPIPFADIWTITPVQIAMVQGIGNIYGYTFDRARIKSVFAVVAGGWLGQQVCLALFKIGMPGAGGFGGSFFVYCWTHGIGHAAERYFASGMTASPDELKQSRKHAIKDAISRKSEFVSPGFLDSPPSAKHPKLIDFTLRRIKDFLRDKKVPYSDEQIERIANKIIEIESYVPRVAIFGGTGAGKSTLCNVIFGKDIAPINHVEACTRNPDEYLLDLAGASALVLIDMPGVGESSTRDDEYIQLYKQVLPTVDLCLWVVKGDDRKLTSDMRIWNSVIKGDDIPDGAPVLVVISQVCKIAPARSWDYEGAKPGAEQKGNIDKKVTVMSDIFGILPERVVPVSAEESYSVGHLVDVIVSSLPPEKQYPFVRNVKTEHITEQTKETANKGFVSTIRNYARDTCNILEPFVPTLVKLIRGWL